MPIHPFNDQRSVSLAVAADRFGCDLLTLARHVERAGIPSVTGSDGIEYFPVGCLIELVLNAAIPTEVVDGLSESVA